MFSLASGVYDSYFAAPQLNVLVIGCESVGKTALLERLKVTEFSTKPPRNNVASRRLTCPAPKRYAQAEVDDHEDDMVMNGGTSQESSKPNGSSHVVTHQSSVESLEDVALETPKQVQRLEPEIEGNYEEFNVKKGSSMLPMVKIRPTSEYFALRVVDDLWAVRLPCV
jgi:GTPase SAR1 family protein